MKIPNLTLSIILSAVSAQSSAQVSGRVYPERNDDLAWENELVAFRAYGPETQRRGEKSYGYDIFLKYPDKGEVLERLYGAQCSRQNWEKVDSLKKIDPVEAKEFEQTFTYHVDHGYGMDCFAVGPTLGCGVAAITLGDSICYPWCYDKVEILENGPDRFVAALTFAPVRIGKDENVTEHRKITLCRNSHLNHCEVSFTGLSSPQKIVFGFPIRLKDTEYIDTASGILAVVDPTQGDENGKVFLGLKSHRTDCSAVVIDNHILMSSVIKPDETLVYDWGFAWDRTDIKSFEQWIEYLTTLKTYE